MAFWKNLDSWASKISGEFFSSKLGRALDSALSSVLKNLTDSGATDKFQEELELSEASNDRLAENAYERNIDFYERYQSPQAQVMQYRAAGLNPALMYGSGASVGASNVSSGGSASASGESNSSALLGTLLSAVFKDKQMKQDRMLKEQDIYTERRRIAAMDTANYLNQQMINSNIGLNSALGSLYSVQGDYYKANTDRVNALYPAEKENLEQNTANLKDALNNNSVLRALQTQNINESEARQALLVRQKALLAVQEKYANEYYDLVNEQLTLSNQLIHYQHQGVKLENKYYRKSLKTRLNMLDKQLEDLEYRALTDKYGADTSKWDFEHLGQKNAREWISTGTQVASTVIQGFTGFGVGMAGLGKYKMSLNVPKSPDVRYIDSGFDPLYSPYGY